MKMNIVLVVLGIVWLKQGYGLQCQVEQCQKGKGQAPEGCQSGGEVHTCKIGYDRCMTMTVTMPGSHGATIKTMYNCSDSMRCSDQSKNMTCESFTKTNGGTCDIQCCQGDKCNVIKTPKVTPATMSPNATKTPTGKDLSCYVCQRGGVKEGNDTSPVSEDCKQQKKCANETGLSENSCGITKYQRKDPKTGKISDGEMRDCVRKIECEGFCQKLNDTGHLVSCNANCCQGNLCNGDHDQGQSTPASPTAGQSLCALINIMTLIIGVLVVMCSN